MPSDQELDEFETFQLLWGDHIIDKMVVATNKKAANDRNNRSSKQRVWKPVDRAEIYRWLGTLIWMGLHPEKVTRLYWNSDQNDGPFHICVAQAMSKTRWEQIYRYLHVCDVEVELQRKANNSTNASKLSAWEKVDDIATHLRTNFKKYCEPGTHVAVDECIARFTGRCADIVNIPTKPTPIGHKIWVLRIAAMS
jgi:transposase IS4-like protein